MHMTGMSSFIVTASSYDSPGLLYEAHDRLFHRPGSSVIFDNCVEAVHRNRVLEGPRFDGAGANGYRALKKLNTSGPDRL
jgi:hypothetical protein